MKFQPADTEQKKVKDARVFSIWLFIIASCMLFAGGTSAVIVRRAEGNWMELNLPPVFVYSTILILLSSITLIWAHMAARKDELQQSRLGLVTTMILGAGFGFLQVLGWGQLVNEGVYFAGNPAGSFVYVITGLHLLHILGGLGLLIATLVRSMQLRVHKKEMTLMTITSTFWHFLGILWIYLYLFLYLNN